MACIISARGKLAELCPRCRSNSPKRSFPGNEHYMALSLALRVPWAFVVARLRLERIKR
jgi:hypothetical protein